MLPVSLSPNHPRLSGGARAAMGSSPLTQPPAHSLLPRCPILTIAETGEQVIENNGRNIP